MKTISSGVLGLAVSFYGRRVDIPLQSEVAFDSKHGFESTGVEEDIQRELEYQYLKPWPEASPTERKYIYRDVWFDGLTVAEICAAGRVRAFRDFRLPFALVKAEEVFLLSRAAFLGGSILLRDGRLNIFPTYFRGDTECSLCLRFHNGRWQAMEYRYERLVFTGSRLFVNDVLPPT